MDELFTWPALATYAGAVIATSLITQLLKDLPFLKYVATRLTSYFISLSLLLLAAFFTGTFSLQNFLLAFVNAAVVSFASNGAFDALIRRGK